MEPRNLQDYHRVFSEFPCAFNLVSANRTTITRLRDAQHNVRVDMDTGSSAMEEIRNKNLLTWIYYRLGKQNAAVKLSNDVVEATGRKNIACLANRFFMLSNTRDGQEAKQCLEDLEKLKEEENFRDLLTEAKAEQAYYYSRLGGPGNLKLAISLFSEVVKKKQDNYLWKFGLGLVYRRATHENIVSSSPDPLRVEDYKLKAAQYLFDVADNADGRLRAMAYSQLVHLREKHRPGRNSQYNNATFRGLGVQELCKKALEFGDNIPSVLIQCGKSIRKSDVDESIRLLEKSLTFKINSTTYHYLAISYKKKAEALCRERNAPLTRDDEYVKKATETFQIAIEITKENFQAVLDLGMLFKETGQIQKALTQINRVTSSHFSSSNHRETVIRAYEQAGLCYIESSKTDTSNTQFEEERKKKLTTAISLAADLALLETELKDRQKLWKAFRTLQSETPSPRQQKNNIQFLELIRKYGQEIEVVKKLQEFTEAQLNDQESITIAITTYLNKNQPENALAFQNMIYLKPDIEDWWTTGCVHDLRIKVLLEAISGRLSDPTENPTALFQRLFQLFFGECFGLRAQENDPKNSPGDVVGDVLVVYDGDYDSQDSPSPAMKSASCLKKVAISLFGLDAEENLKGCGEFGDFQSKGQLEEMAKYKVVIIILDSEIRSREFDVMLRTLAEFFSKELAERPRIVVVDAGLKDGHFPLYLKQYENTFKLEDIGGLGDIEQSSVGQGKDDQHTAADILKYVFHGDVDAILKLFCFIIGQQWPLP